jgi:hypothetical protein
LGKGKVVGRVGVWQRGKNIDWRRWVVEGERLVVEIRSDERVKVETVQHRRLNGFREIVKWLDWSETFNLRCTIFDGWFNM